MVKLLSFLLSFTTFFTESHLQSSALDHRLKYGDELTSRYIAKSDIKTDVVVGIPLRVEWWSRPHEYAWSMQFADKDAVVLDAACGVSHPFKWYLGETCKTTWACDTDARIDNVDAIKKETFLDLGEKAYNVLTSNPRLINQVTLVKASISNLPARMPKFDRIFCISTLEHLSKKEQADAIAEFARFLSPNGLLVLTTDYPEVTPQALIQLAYSVNLVPAGDVSFEKPEDCLTNGNLCVYRSVFMHKNI